MSAIRGLYEKLAGQVYVDGKLSDTFDITTDVLQGNVLVTILFIIVIDYVTEM